MLSVQRSVTFRTAVMPCLWHSLHGLNEALLFSWQAPGATAHQQQLGQQHGAAQPRGAEQQAPRPGSLALVNDGGARTIQQGPLPAFQQPERHGEAAFGFAKLRGAPIAPAAAAPAWVGAGATAVAIVDDAVKRRVEDALRALKKEKKEKKEKRSR